MIKDKIKRIHYYFVLKFTQGEYEAKAKKADRRFGNTPIGEVGRLQQKLLNFGRVRGLVVGGWGELSDDFKFLLQVMAEKKKQELEAQTGVEHRQLVTAQLASYVSLNRQQLSRVCVQAQSRLLLDRLDWLGGGVGEAASRRKAWLEARREKERQANIIAARQGWRIRRTGDFRV